MQITVYDKPGCVQCRATEKWLTRKDIPYTTVDVTANDDDYRACLALGYQQLPVVVVSTGVTGGDVHWSGHRPDRLAEHTN